MVARVCSLRNLARLFEQRARREMFQPTLLGVLTNPFYLTRRGIAEGISRNSWALGGKMLDLGCGTKPYRAILDPAAYVGVDVLDMKNSSRKTPSVDVWFDGYRLPFANASFDSVLCSEVLEHVFDPNLLLREVHRVCRPGAKLLITVPFVWPEHEQPFDRARYTTFGLKALVESEGFRVVGLEKAGTWFETIIQMWNTMWFEKLLSSSRVIKTLMTAAFLAPLSIIGRLVSQVCAGPDDLYLTNVLLAELPNSLAGAEGLEPKWC